jgi:hypothetical protein
MEPPIYRYDWSSSLCSRRSNADKKRTPSQAGQGSCSFRPNQNNLALELFVEFAGGAGDVHTARHAAFPIFDALHNAGRFGALGTIRALRGIHFLLTVARFRNLCHDLSNLLPLGDSRRRMTFSLSLALFAAEGPQGPIQSIRR